MVSLIVANKKFVEYIYTHQYCFILFLANILLYYCISWTCLCTYQFVKTTQLVAVELSPFPSRNISQSHSPSIGLHICIRPGLKEPFTKKVHVIKFQRGWFRQEYLLFDGFINLVSPPSNCLLEPNFPLPKLIRKGLSLGFMLQVL